MCNVWGSWWKFENVMCVMCGGVLVEFEIRCLFWWNCEVDVWGRFDVFMKMLYVICGGRVGGIVEMMCVFDV